MVLVILVVLWRVAAREFEVVSTFQEGVLYPSWLPEIVVAVVVEELQGKADADKMD